MAKVKHNKKPWCNRVLVVLGVAMILAGVGCVALFFIGPPGGSAGTIPTTPSSTLLPPEEEEETLAVEDHPSKQEEKGPEDKTLYLTVPKLGLENVVVHDSLSEEALEDSTIHIPGTGFPWQGVGANTYIAGHRMGYLGTGSFLVFFRLNELVEWDEIILRDSIGNKYTYRVTEALVVAPEDVGVTAPVAGKSMVSLQTCTLPDFLDRLVIRGELVSVESV